MKEINKKQIFLMSENTKWRIMKTIFPVTAGAIILFLTIYYTDELKLSLVLGSLTFMVFLSLIIAIESLFT